MINYWILALCFLLLAAVLGVYHYMPEKYKDHLIMVLVIIGLILMVLVGSSQGL